MEQEIDYNLLDSFEIHSMYLTRCLLVADVSDFSDNEIRTLTPKNPVHLRDKWDGILEAKKPILGSYGMNKERELFVYVNNSWKSCY